MIGEDFPGFGFFGLGKEMEIIDPTIGMDANDRKAADAGQRDLRINPSITTGLFIR